MLNPLWISILKSNIYPIIISLKISEQRFMETKLKWFTSQKGKLFFYKKTASLIASRIISLVKIFWLSFYSKYMVFYEIK